MPWNAPLGPFLPGASVAKNTFTTLAALTVGETTGAVTQIPAGALYAGAYLTVEAWGVASNTATPTLQLDVYYGATGAVDLALGVAKTTTTAMTNWHWHVYYTGRVLAVGTAGSIIGHGFWYLPTSLTAWSEFNMPEVADAAVTIDTTVAKTIGVGAAWGASSVSNTITTHGCLVDIHGVV